MNRRRRFDVADFVALLPLCSWGILLFFGSLASLQVGHWPVYSQPDPKDVALAGGSVYGPMISSLTLAALLSLVGLGGIGAHAAPILVNNLVKRRWSDGTARVLVQVALGTAGFVLFWAQSPGMVTWLLD